MSKDLYGWEHTVLSKAIKPLKKPGGQVQILTYTFCAQTQPQTNLQQLVSAWSINYECKRVVRPLHVAPVGRNNENGNQFLPYEMCISLVFAKLCEHLIRKHRNDRKTTATVPESISVWDKLSLHEKKWKKGLDWWIFQWLSNLFIYKDNQRLTIEY